MKIGQRTLEEMLEVYVFPGDVANGLASDIRLWIRSVRPLKEPSDTVHWCMGYNQALRDYDKGMGV